MTTSAPRAPVLSSAAYPIPSAPSLEAQKESTQPVIHWNAVPAINPPAWHQTTKIRQLASDIFLSLGAVAGIGAVYSATYLIASASTIVMATCGLGLLTASFLAAGIALKMLAPHPRDPNLILEQRLTLKSLVETKSAAINLEILEGYCRQEIITEEELQKILFFDISSMTYSAFIDKYSKTARTRLDAVNKKTLRENYINHCYSHAEGGLLKILNEEESLFFELSSDEIAPAIVNREISSVRLKQITYDKFIQRNGHDAIRNATNENHTCLSEAFKIHVFRLMENQGTHNIEKTFEKDFEIFGNQVKDEVIAEVVKQQVKSWVEEKHSYADLKKVISSAQLQSYLESYPEEAPLIKNAYLAISYADRNTHSDDKSFLRVTDEEIKESLRSRWKDTDFATVLKNESNDFFQALEDKKIAPQDFTAAAIVEFEKVPFEDALNLDERLFTHGLLKPDTPLSNGSTIAIRWEELLSRYQNFYDLYEQRPMLLQNLFSRKLISKEDPRLAGSVSAYVVDYAEFFLGGTVCHMPADPTPFIEKYDLLSPHQKKLLADAKNEIAAAKSTLESKLAEINVNDTKKIETQNACCKEKIESISAELGLPKLKKAVKDKKEAVNSLKMKHENAKKLCSSKAAESKDITRELSAKQAELLGLKEELATKTAALNNTRAVAELERMVQATKDAIQRDSKNLKLRLEIDTDMIELREEIKTCESQMKALEAKRTAANEYSGLEQNLTKLQGEITTVRKEELQNIIRKKTLESPSADSVIDDLKKKIKTAQSQIQQRKTYDQWVSEREKLNNQLSSKDEKKAKLLKEIEKLEDDRNKTQGISNAFAALWNPLESKKKELASLPEAEKQQEVRLAALSKQINESSATSLSIEDLSKTKSDLESTKAKFEKQIKEAAEAEKELRKIQQIESQIESIKAKLAKLQLLHSGIAVSSFKESVESELHQNQATARDVNLKLVARKNETTNYFSNNKKKLDLEKLERELSSARELNAATGALRLRIESKNEEIETLHDTSKNLEDAISDAEASAKKAKSELSIAQEALTNAKEAWDAKAAEFDLQKEQEEKQLAEILRAIELEKQAAIERENANYTSSVEDLTARFKSQLQPAVMLG